tara:strand:- start:4 stop:786 length:783 start_codon:yes stop_codon:yes gene_type:complete
MLLNRFVIGSTVEAAYYALVNDFFFIPTRKMPPMFYNKLNIPILKATTEPEAWNKINIELGLSSKRVAFDKFEKIKVEENFLKIITGNTTFKYEFDKVFIFDTTNVQVDNKIIKAKEKTYTVLDDFELSILGPKRYNLPSITQDDETIKQLHFYSSDRVDGSDYITDCVVESEMTQDQLGSVEYSDSMIRFVVERHLASVGVKGRFMKYYDSGAPKYRKPKVKHVSRLTFEKDNNKYKDTEKVKFVNFSLKDIDEIRTQR